MKSKLFTLTLAVLTVGLLGSCSKINERIDGLEKRVDGIENEQITSINTQVEKINSSIAGLGTIRENISSLKTTTEAQAREIAERKKAEEALGGRVDELEEQAGTLDNQVEDLKEADIALGQRIDDLRAFVDDTLGAYATKEWVKATFSTLEQYEATCDTIAKIDTRIGALDAKLSQSISGLESSLKQWVNEQLDAYYTAAQMDAKLGVMQAEIDALKNSKYSERINSLATELTKTKVAVDTAKANIRSEYKAAIQSAIETSEGKLTKALKDSIAKVNGKIAALDTRVTDLESRVLTLEGNVGKLLAMIQSVSITPAYSDGSVEAVKGILTLKCIVSPAKAISGMESLKDSLLLYADSVKVKTKATTPAYMTIEVSEASVLDAAQGAITLTADISEYLPKGEDKALTVAINIKNGISNFTTEFVPVTLAAPAPLPTGALAGEFTVAEGKKVHFSQGNLTYNVSTTTWAFYEHQYDCATGYDSNLISLFTWGYGTWSTSPNGTDYQTGDFTDWGSQIGDGNTWRTLTTAEWQYLFNNHTKKWATVNGVNGYVIAPDDFSGELANTYADDAALAANNLVFLPAAGSRNGSDVDLVGGLGDYWSSSAYDEFYAYIVDFDSSSVYPDSSDYRSFGFSVRLITESK